MAETLYIGQKLALGLHQLLVGMLSLVPPNCVKVPAFMEACRTALGLADTTDEGRAQLQAGLDVIRLDSTPIRQHRAGAFKLLKPICRW